MHILYFHQHFSTPRGAAGIRSYKMSQALIREGHRVTMVCGSYARGQTGLEGSFRGGRRSGLVNGIDVIEFDLSYSNSDGFMRRAWLFARFALSGMGLALTADYDRLIASTTPLTAGLPGIVARWLRSKPFVFEVRDLWPELPRAMGVIRNPLILSLMSALEWASYRSAQKLVGLSPGIVAGIARRGVSSAKISMIPNGCDLEIFGASVAPWRPLGVREAEMMAVFAGTHGRANGLDAVLDAAALLKTRGSDNIKIVLIGDGHEKPRLRARARDEGLDNVVFHAPVDKARLASLMAATDLGLQCLANVPAFYFGTSPNKFFDYIAAGLPVLINYPGWVADLIRDARCGFVTAPESPAAFADALQQAADHRGELRQMGVRAANLARQSFNRHHLATQWVSWVTGGDERL